MQTPVLSPLDPKSTALLLIDLQNGIVGMPTAPLPAEQVISNARKLVEAFHRLEAQVILVRVAGALDGKDMLHPDADEPMVRSGPRPDGWSEIVPDLSPQGNDLVITKRQWGAFYGTELDLELRRRGISTIVLGGISTNYGVESTARDAYERGYRLVFAGDAMAARETEDHEFAIRRIFPRIGRIRSTEQIIQALEEAKD